MGATALGLPYPEPGDPANVPDDMHALALGVDTLIGRVPINYPVAAKGATSGAINLAYTTGANSLISGVPSVSIKNPHPTASLLVRAVMHGGVKNSASNTCYVYVNASSGVAANKTPLQTGIKESTPNISIYFAIEVVVYLAPGATGVFNAYGHKAINAAGPQIYSTHISVLPITYTLNALPIYIEPAPLIEP